MRKKVMAWLLVLTLTIANSNLVPELHVLEM